MRLLYICNDMSLSGSPQAIKTETAALVCRGHEVWVASRDGPLAGTLKEAGVHWIEADIPIIGAAEMPVSPTPPVRERALTVARYVNRLRLPKLVLQMSRLVRSCGIQVIQAHQPGAVQAAHLVSRLTGVPFVVRVQHSLRNEFPPLLYRWVLSDSAGISVITPEIQSNLARVYGISEGKTRVIPTGVDLQGFGEVAPLAPSPDFLRITSISTLGDAKYIPARTLLEAALLVKSSRRLQLFIVGDGSRKQELTEQAGQVNVSLGYEAVQVVGAKSDVRPYLEAADLVVGVGRVAMEALAAGRLLLCASQTASAGLFGPDTAREIADFNFSGRQTSIRPTPEQFAGLIETLSTWPGQRLVEHATWGQNWVQSQFGICRIIEDTERLFIEACPSSRVGSAWGSS